MLAMAQITNLGRGKVLNHAYNDAKTKIEISAFSFGLRSYDKKLKLKYLKNQHAVQFSMALLLSNI